MYFVRGQHTWPVIVTVMAMLAAMLSGSARADPDSTEARVAVVVTVRVNLDEAGGQRLAGALTAAINAAFALQTVSPEHVAQKLAGLTLPADCATRRRCVAKVGKRLGAAQVLFVVLVRVGGRVRIEATWAEVGSGRSQDRAPFIVPTGEDEWAAALATSAQALLPEAPVRAIQKVDSGPQPSPASAPLRDKADSGSPPAVNAAVPAEPNRLAVQRSREPAGRRLSTPTLIAAGAGVSALALGSWFAIGAYTDHSDLRDDGCDERACPERRATIDRLRRRALTADLLFTFAALAGGTATYLYLRTPNESGGFRLEVGDHRASVSWASEF